MTLRLIITRAGALSAGLPTYFTGIPCKRGHVAERFVSSWICRECAASSETKKKCDRAWARQNVDRSRAIKVRWKANNPDKVAAGNARYWARPEVKVANKAAKHLEKTRDPIGFKARNAARTQRRYADKLRATPKWADLNLIAGFYDAAAAITERTGVEHEVDHIVPLHGKNVRGLHVQNNLRIVTRLVNRSKANKLIESLLDAAA